VRDGPTTHSALTVLLGGARSGKSSLAVQWARVSGLPVVFVATGRAGDAEMRARIARHRAQRPDSWTTVEQPEDPAAAVDAAPADAFVIVDCLTLWVADVFERCDDGRVLARATDLAATAARRAAPTVVVSNEVGSGIVPAGSATRRYRDLLGGVNATVAQHAATAWLVVAGRVLALEPAPPAVPDAGDERGAVTPGTGPGG
jgi:adenosylcobinamide kinase/adenosylcobinamide-phosphate guanylyltransferase